MAHSEISATTGAFVMSAPKPWWQLVISISVLFIVLGLPHWPGNLSLLWFARLPLELPVLFLALVITHGTTQRGLGVVIAVTLGALTFLKIANLVTYTGFARPFNILVDPALVWVALSTASQSQGAMFGAGLVVAFLATITITFSSLWWATLTLASRCTPVFKGRGITLATLMLICAFALQDVKLTSAWWPVTSFETSKFAVERVASVAEGLRNDRRFREEMATSDVMAIPTDQRLARLKNIDVLLVFAESYGRVALDDPSQGTTLRATLQQFEIELSKKGFASRSAWLTSPTFGGQSWLAHGTFLSGLWLDDQGRYDSLFISNRDTVIGDFGKNGWRTVAVMPQITLDWPEADFFGYDKIYAAQDLNYQGQSFDYMTMPDQYTLAVLDKRELSPKDRRPIMAEIGLVSGHIPWAPLPLLIAWDEVGNGSVFDIARTPTVDVDWLNQAQLKQDYTRSMDYVLRTLLSFLLIEGRENIVMIIVGDHQPAPIVSGQSATHDVPIHIIASNPALLTAIDDWHWTVGMMPTDSSPIWRMDVMREKILSAFTPPTDVRMAQDSAQ